MGGSKFEISAFFLNTPAQLPDARGGFADGEGVVEAEERFGEAALEKLDAGEKVRGFEACEEGLGSGELSGLLPGEPEEKGGGAVIGVGSHMLLVERRGFIKALLLVKLEGLLFDGLGE